MSVIPFSKWNGDDGLKEFIVKTTGCNPFSGAGITPRIKNNTTILRSVDDTYYYDDDLSDENIIKYTLFGHNGDQDENEKKFNEPLLNIDKTHHIYVYRVRQIKDKSKYLWYGKYKIIDKYTQKHIGKDYNPRNIVILKLKKV